MCFKNPWCQTHIFLGEPLISCIVPGNHGLFSGQQRGLPNRSPLHPQLCLLQDSPKGPHFQASTPTPDRLQGPHLHLHNNRNLYTVSILELPALRTPLPALYCFCYRSWESAMKSSVLEQDKEIICCSTENHNMMLLLVSSGEVFRGFSVLTERCIWPDYNTAPWQVTQAAARDDGKTVPTASHLSKFWWAIKLSNPEGNFEPR